MSLDMSSPTRTRVLCETVSEVLQLTMKAQTRAMARTNKEIASKESVRRLMRLDCERLGMRNLDMDLPPVVHVAGTKGKGSTCALLESILRKGRLRTGLFTSPHLVDVRERIRINGMVLPQATFDDHIMETYRLLGSERMETVGFFQFMTLVTFRLFAKTTPNREEIDVLVLETGIGGRLDFTNALDEPLCCAITRLDYDHTDILGNTLSLIAAEKAGIIKSNVRLFTPRDQAQEGLVVLSEACRKLNAPFEMVSPLPSDEMTLGIGGGAHQRENAGIAMAMAKYIFSTLQPGRIVERDVYAQGLADCRFPGRAQTETGQNGQKFYLDGAHTPLSVECATRWFRETVPLSETKILVFHCSPDRDAKSLLQTIKQLIPELKKAYFIPPRSGINAGGSGYHESLASIWNALDAENDGQAYTAGPEEFKKDLNTICAKGVKHVYVVGSFYIVGDALKYWVDGWNVEEAFTKA